MADDPVREFLDDELPGVPLDDDDELLQPGRLDSLGVVRLVAAIEDRYAIVIEQDEIHPQNFKNVKTVRALIDRKRGIS